MELILESFFSWQNLWYLGGILVVYLVTYVYVGNSILKALNETINEIIQSLDKDSDGGQKITEAEAKEIAKKIANLVKIIILKKIKIFGFLGKK